MQVRFHEQWIGNQVFPQTVSYRISVSVRATTRATTRPNECSSRSATESKLWLEGCFEVPLCIRRDFRNLRKSSLKIRGRPRGDSLPRSDSPVDTESASFWDIQLKSHRKMSKNHQGGRQNATEPQEINGFMELSGRRSRVRVSSPHLKSVF